MRTIAVKVDDDLHRNVRILVAKDGLTIQDYIVRLIMKDLEDKKPQK